MPFKRGNPGCCSCGGSGGTATIAGCGCTAIPTTLYLRVNNTAYSSNVTKDCTLVYGPVPSGYAGLALGANAFISSETLVDQIGQNYQHYWTCSGSNYTVTRIYITSIFGSPYRDSTRYTWSASGTGNTCSPFYLARGTVYPGGDSRLIVEIKPTSGAYSGP